MALCLPCLPFVRLQLCSGVPGMMSWRESMNIETKRNKLLRMTPEQFQEARKLIQKTCANYNSGNCLLLDDGEPCRCPQLGAYSVICRYFRDAVLPGDMRLYYSVIGQKPKCYCILCGSPVYSVQTGRSTALLVPRRNAAERRLCGYEIHGREMYAFRVTKTLEIPTFFRPHVAGGIHLYHPLSYPGNRPLREARMTCG